MFDMLDRLDPFSLAKNAQGRVLVKPSSKTPLIQNREDKMLQEHDLSSLKDLDLVTIQPSDSHGHLFVQAVRTVSVYQRRIIFVLVKMCERPTRFNLYSLLFLVTSPTMVV